MAKTMADVHGYFLKRQAVVAMVCLVRRYLPYRTECCYNSFNMERTNAIIAEPQNEPLYQCFSCGTTENIGKRRYCSKECRTELLRRLEIMSGLLRALEARYASFSFTDSALVLDVLTNGSKKGYRFLYKRKRNSRPAHDLYHMADELGSQWWEKQKQTGKRYRASRHVFESAAQSTIPFALVTPLEIKSPLRIGKSRMCLKLRHEDLNSQNSRRTVKSAYRREALKHHPDRGGKSASFRKVNTAYEELLQWLEAPELRTRRGIPGKWFFDGKTWKSPLRPQ